ncbi:MAG: H-NS histone family protein [Telluria sp.]
MDLSELSTMELRALSSQVAKQVHIKEEQEKQRALDEIMSIARNIGVPLGELVSTVKTAPLRRNQPRYANPNNRSETWTGFGRQPHWLKAHLAAGNSLESALI